MSNRKGGGGGGSFAFGVDNKMATWKLEHCRGIDFALFPSDGEADLEQVGDVMAVAGLLKLFLVGQG